MNSFLVALAELAVIVSLAILIVCLVRSACRRWSGARLSYAAWCLIPLTIFAYITAAALPATHFSNALPTAMQPPSLSFVSARSAVPAALQSEQLWLAAYVIGVIAFALWLFVKQRQFTRSVGSLVVAPFTHAGVPVYFANTAAHGPFVKGLFRPTIVLPIDFVARYDETEQQLMLAHESAHLRGGDLYINAFAALLQVAFWFNPLVHWAATRMRFDQELACDEVVLQKGRFDRDRIATYANAILKSTHPQISSPIVCHWQASHPLNRRIQLMSAPISKLRSRRIATALLCSALVVSTVAVYAAAERSGVPGAGQYRIEIEYTGIDTDLPPADRETTAEFALVLNQGEYGSFKVGARSNCEFSISVKPVENDVIRMAFPHTCDGVHTSNPALITKLGVASTIQKQVQSDVSNKSHTLRFVITAGPEP